MKNNGLSGCEPTIKMEKVKTIFEYNEELKMYDNLIIFLQDITTQTKINSKSLYSLMELFKREREYFLGILNGKEDKYDLIKTPKNEYFLGNWNRTKQNEITIIPKDNYNKKIYERGKKKKK